MPSQISSPADPVHENWDVVVLGAGAAGLAAAVFAAQDGARTVLIERSASLGGTSALSAGTVWIPNTRHAATTGVADNPERASAFLDAAVGNRAPKAMRERFLEAGPEAVRRLEDTAAVQFRARPFHPDYLYDLDGSVSGGRALEAQPYDGGALGSALRRLRPPIPEFTVLGGMMVDRDDIGHLLKMTRSGRSLVHAVRLIGGYAIDRLRHGRGARLVMGNALVGRLLRAALDLGVTILTDTEIIDIAGDGGCRTVKIRRTEDQQTLRASGGVILASGGFARHPERRSDFLPGPQPEHSPAAPGNTGALHDIALRLGALWRRCGATGVLGAGFAPDATRWFHGGVSALRARPLQARDHHGWPGRSAFRQ